MNISASSLLRRLFSAVLRTRLVPDLKIDSCRLGSDYGGWAIIPGLIDQDSIIYSFGVGEDASFDLALIESYGATVFAFDPTPKAIKWVEQQNIGANFRFFPLGISDGDGQMTVYAPENPSHVSYTVLEGLPGRHDAVSVEVRRLPTIMHELGHDRLDILKMDIEGAEYRVIHDICQSNIRPKQILLEFHHFMPGLEYQTTVASVRELRKCGYRVFSISPSGHEFSLIHY
jgi:FkbM family methyltransferase